MSGSSPNWTKGYIPSASEWNSWWAKKLDTTIKYLSSIGGTVTGLITSTPGPYHGSGGTNEWEGYAVGLNVTSTGSDINASAIALESNPLTGRSSYQLSNYDGTFYIAHMPTLNDYSGNVPEEDLFTLNPTFGASINTDLSVAGDVTLMSKTTTINAFSFGNSAAVSTSNLTRHLQIYSTTYGINYTTNRMNFVVPTAGSATFVVNGVDILTVSSTKVTINKLNLTGLPTSPTGLVSGDAYLNGGFLMVMP